ncbi:Uu.00g064690.m01.CDS01 [Anthostomella pinea]|uniref:Uu.00g064690.m01.CDS01 n=1 Tax=Anthostomella pinea TaxID=933095 RepID=A0AAI8VUD4_9PEZI|nr:Uu.00g064690.m01.CDS01 [Anthostomella pinea]
MALQLTKLLAAIMPLLSLSIAAADDKGVTGQDCNTFTLKGQSGLRVSTLSSSAGPYYTLYAMLFGKTSANISNFDAFETQHLGTYLCNAGTCFYEVPVTKQPKDGKKRPMWMVEFDGSNEKNHNVVDGHSRVVMHFGSY